MAEVADVSYLHILLQRLQSEETSTRHAAIDELQALDKEKLTAEQGRVLLQGAAGRFPPHKYNHTDIPAAIVSILMARKSPEPSWAAPAAEVYASLTDRARRNALALLAAIGDRPALTHYVDLLKNYGPPTDHPHLAWPQLRSNPRHGDIVFPDLLAFTSTPKLGYEVLIIALAYLEKGTFPDHATTRLGDFLAECWAWITENVEASRKHQGDVTSDAYRDLRALAELVVDICGRVGGPETERIMSEALNFSDRRVISFAVIAAVRRGLAPPAEALMAAAEQPGPRHILFYGLQDLGRTDVFPDQYRTHAALAEAEMCNWLAYPTELGREPDEIEQVAVIPLTDPALDLYVFRYRMLGDHRAASKGWLAGVAGPFRRSERPNLPGGVRKTFSRMEPWSSRDLEGHVEAHLGYIEELTRLRGDPSQQNPQAAEDGVSSDQAEWNRLEQVWKNRKIVLGKILNRTDGGFTVDLGGVVAFLPASQIVIRSVPDLNLLKTDPRPFKILKMDRERGTIVVSRHAALKAIRAARMKQFEIGQVVEGVVDKMTDNVAFVDLGRSVIALLSPWDIAWRRPNRPSEALRIGQQVKVKVIKIDREGLIRVGIKQLLDDPWDGVEAKFPVGDRFRGRITKIQDYGCLVELEAGVEGLLHVSDIPSTQNGLSPADLFSMGQEIDVQILEINAVKRRMTLRT